LAEQSAYIKQQKPAEDCAGEAFLRRMKLSATLERVKKVVVDKLNVTDSEVTEEASFIDDLGADSLDVVELVMGFEEEFGIQIPDEDAEKIQTVKQAVEYIESRIAE